MSVPTVNVTLELRDQTNDPLVGARVLVKLTNTDVSTAYIVTEELTFTTDENGLVVMALWPNELGATESRYRVRAWDNTTGRKVLDVLATIPNSDCNLPDVAELPPYPGKPEGGVAAAQAGGYAVAAANSESAALASENKANEWAEKEEDVEVDGGQYSALHHSAKANAQRVLAETARQGAETAEGNAGNSASAALVSEQKSAKWADEAEDTEVEVGKYSSKHHALKALETVAPFIYHLADTNNPHNTTAEQVGADPAGAAASAVSGHESTNGHLTPTQLTDMTDAGDSALHYHASDRGRANHTGTQLASTISDFASAALAAAPAETTATIGTLINGATGKTAPADADKLALADSAASWAMKGFTWANLKAEIKSYYDSVTATLTNKTLTNPVLSDSASGADAGKLGYSAGTLTYGTGSSQKTIATTDDLSSGSSITEVTVTPPTDANYTLLAAEYTADKINLDLSNWTGSHAIVVPDEDRRWTYYNTSATITPTVKTSAGTGETVPVSSSRLLECDETNVIDPLTAYTLTTNRMALGYISGGIWSNGTDADHDLDFTACECRDSTNVVDITVSAMTKQFDAAWAAGTAAGGLDTGALANSTEYYIHAIRKDSYGSGEVLASTSRTAPTMPSGYTKFRHIGWFKTDGSANIVQAIVTETNGGGVFFQWVAPPTDINLSGTLTTSARLDAISVMTGVKCKAVCNGYVYDGAATAFALQSDPDISDVAADTVNATMWSITSFSHGQQVEIMTNTSRQIRTRATVATVDTYALRTYAFEWSRR